MFYVKYDNNFLGYVDPKIHTKYLIVIESLIWRRKDYVGNDIF